ncbi:MAG: gephyrin-like molybdotransferase Glp [Granulosicoccus sp.]
MVDKQPSCADAAEPELLPVHEARLRMLAGLTVLKAAEKIALGDAVGRVLSQAVVSPINVPAENNSAMDGYAITSASIPISDEPESGESTPGESTPGESTPGESTLKVLGTSWAGRPYENSVRTGEAVRIFTGAVMPAGADTVVIQEHVQADEDSVRIDSAVVAGRNVRAAGEDVQQGQLVLDVGRRLVAADIGVIASLGIDSVRVTRRLKVACFSTGDELCALAQYANTRLPAGMLFDSNSWTLRALLESSGVELIDLGIVRDTAEDTRAALTRAADEADVIVTSGGVSAGEADFVTEVFHEMGEVSFWKIAMRPGRPLAFGRVGKAAFFGLPGNPVAVMVTFLQFVQPALRHMAGMHDIAPLELPAKCLNRLRKSTGRMEYQRGLLRLSDGELVVESTGKQGAGRLSSMSAANCLIVVAAEVASVSPGDRVMVQPFYGLLPG